jgi:hypothetical protein
MEEAKRAREAETPKQPSQYLRSSAPHFYPDPNYLLVRERLAAPFQLRLIENEEIYRDTYC